jgi:hypothetical protein
MMSAGPFVAVLKCSGNVFWGFSSFAWQRGTSQLIAIHLITLHNILQYMQISIIQTGAADFVKLNICVILKTFGHDCIHCRSKVWGHLEMSLFFKENHIFCPLK